MNDLVSSFDKEQTRRIISDILIVIVLEGMFKLKVETNVMIVIKKIQLNIVVQMMIWELLI